MSDNNNGTTVGTETPEWMLVNLTEVAEKIKKDFKWGEVVSPTWLHEELKIPTPTEDTSYYDGIRVARVFTSQVRRLKRIMLQMRIYLQYRMRLGYELIHPTQQWLVVEKKGTNSITRTLGAMSLGLSYVDKTLIKAPRDRTNLSLALGRLTEGTTFWKDIIRRFKESQIKAKKPTK